MEMIGRKTGEPPIKKNSTMGICPDCQYADIMKITHKREYSYVSGWDGETPEEFFGQSEEILDDESPKYYCPNCSLEFDEPEFVEVTC